ncbi:MAG: transglycosylase domain-containing protein [Spirochaetales bacterium]
MRLRRVARLTPGAVAFFLVTDLALRWVLLLAPYPELDAFVAQPASAVVTDRAGRLLQVTALEGGLRRLDTPLSQIPASVKQIFLRAEDRRFYLHDGLDLWALARSAADNLVAGRVVSGASTISMQLARLVHPRGSGWVAKALEALDAARLEARLNKDRILELWLDHLPFSSRLAGVEAAARGVFGIALTELTVEQTTLLAVIPRRPALYDPRVDPGSSAAAALRLFGPEASEGALESLVSAARASASTPPFPKEAPHYVRLLEASTPGGLHGRVVTSLDLELQQRLEAAIRKNLKPWYANRLRNGAGLVLDNVSGNVLAWVGSADFDDAAELGQNDGVLATSQPGSALKPFLYALALERGLSPATVLPDLPTDFGSAEVYSPSNFNGRFNGPVRLRVALASSLNVPAVEVLQRVGVRPFENWLRDLGFASLERQRGTLGVGLALGNAEVSLREMVSAFAVFPRGGLDLAGKQVMSATTAAQIRDILSDQPSRFLGFGSSRTLQRDYDAMFKTGTANQYQQVWALGATAQVTIGVWMGNFRGQTVIGRTGSGIPAKALVEVLDTLATPADPESANWWRSVPASHTLRICTLSGLAATDNCPTMLESFADARGSGGAASDPPPCTWHHPGGRVTYPAEYASWVTGGGRAGLGASQETVPGTDPEILSPANGAVYYLNPQKPLASQAVPVRVAGAPGALVTVDGRSVAYLDSTGTAALPLTAGVHRLQVGGATASYEVR